MPVLRQPLVLKRGSGLAALDMDHVSRVVDQLRIPFHKKPGDRHNCVITDSGLTFPLLTETLGSKFPDQPFRIGSNAHKQLFCSLLFDTFNPYEPAIIDWPLLDEAAEMRLISLPIWDIAVETENRAGLNVSAYAKLLSDSILRDAVSLMGFEERRHRHVLANMVAAYGIQLKPEPAYLPPSDPEWAFLVTGYSECIDSFFAFGLFETAKRSGFFPEELVRTFEPVIQEEARHIVFFVNWAAWHRRNLLFWQRCRFEWKVLRVWAFLVRERLGIAREMGKGQPSVRNANFTVTGANLFGNPIGIAQLINICLAENDRRLGDFDRRLKRPRLVPGLAKWIRALFRSHT